jgi:hypothetical protein
VAVKTFKEKGGGVEGPVLRDGQLFSDFMEGGLLLEAQVLEAASEIRERSKRGYKQEWRDARLLLTATLAKLLAAKSGVPGSTNQGRSDRILLVASFVQGIGVTETLISEGQYIKAAAVLKQDYEILTRIRETKAGAAKPGQTPQVRHAPEGSQHFYGDLNKIAHPSNPALIAELLQVQQTNQAIGSSFVPRYVEQTASSLYELHVWLLLESTREAILLMAELYGAEEAFMADALIQFHTALAVLERAGFRPSL